MKNTFTLSFIILFGQLLTSCLDLDENKPEDISSEKDFTSVLINNEYRIRVPKYMKKANDLNDEASLQYQNIFKETYIIVIDESKEEFISIFQELEEYDNSISTVKNYRNIQLKFFNEVLDISRQSNSKSTKIGNLNSEVLEIDAYAEDVNDEIAYFLTFIEGEEKLYMIMAWTFKSQKGKYKSTFEKMVESFELVHS